MSSTEEGPDGMGCQSHYSLRWNNHQNHILEAFDALFHAELLVDVTLVCNDTSLKAHKVVLSVCSPFFERMFAEHPCKHPVIVLKDFTGREIAALLDFMYRGEVRVAREELPGLVKAAESLQVRGLIASEPRLASSPSTPETTELIDNSTIEPPSPAASRELLDDIPYDQDQDQDQDELPTLLFTRPSPHNLHPGYNNSHPREICTSPLMPRRKQARPRRRSGELLPQDLSRPHPQESPVSVSGLNLSQSHGSPGSTSGLNLSNHTGSIRPSSRHSEPAPSRNNSFHQQQLEDVAENLSMKRERSPCDSAADHSETTGSPRTSPLTGTSLRPDASFTDIPAPGMTAMSALSLTPPHHPGGGEYLASLGQFAAQWFPPGHGRHRDESPQHPALKSPFGYPPSESPRVPCFPLDGAAAGLFPHGPLDHLHDGFKPDGFPGFFGPPGPLPQPQDLQPPTKKKKKRDSSARRWAEHRGLPPGVCRPKGQHSAPRGGPPRSWTNADLTEALTMVWNKKMTTSQASRIYGIPYNSLLMYVRGKYGKSLKLEQLRKDCVAGDVMNSLNNNVKSEPSGVASRLAGLGGPEDAFNHHHPLLSGSLPQGFFPDFGAAFPVPVNMVHLLPPSEQKGFDGPEPANLGRSPSPAAGLEAQPPPAILQQNGAAD